MDVVINAGNETHNQFTNSAINLEGNLNIPVNTLSIKPYTCNINTTPLSNNNVYKTAHNITDVSDTTASYVSCNFVESPSHAPECTVSPFVNISKNKKVIKPPLSPYQALRYPRTHKGKAVKKPTSVKHEVASKTKRSGIG